MPTLVGFYVTKINVNYPIIIFFLLYCFTVSSSVINDSNSNALSDIQIVPDNIEADIINKITKIGK